MRTGSTPVIRRRRARDCVHYSSSLKIVEPAARHLPGQSTTREAGLPDRQGFGGPGTGDHGPGDQGRTAILSEDPPSARQAGFTELVNVLGKVVAEVRVAELRYPDGTTEFAPTRVVLNRGEEAVKAAVNAVIRSSALGYAWRTAEFRTRPLGVPRCAVCGQSLSQPEMRILAAIRIWGVLHYFRSLRFDDGRQVGRRPDGISAQILGSQRRPRIPPGGGSNDRPNRRWGLCREKL